MNKNTAKPNQGKKSDIAVWLLIVAITAVSVYANYHFRTISAPIKIIGWIGWFIVAALLAITTQAGKNGVNFLKDSRTELRKVVWPSRQETVQTTVIVMIMVAITSVILWALDSGFMWFVGKITRVSG